VQGVVLGRAVLGRGSWQAGDPHRGQLLLSNAASRRFFALLVDPPPPGLGLYGLPLDAPNTAVNAYDIADWPAAIDRSRYTEALSALWHRIEAAKLGGVIWRLIPQPPAYVPPEPPPDEGGGGIIGI
jgi:hypothetical protein